MATPVVAEALVQPRNVSRSGLPGTGYRTPPSDGIRSYAGGSALHAPERRSVLSFLRNPPADVVLIHPVTAPASVEAVPMPGQRLSTKAIRLAQPADASLTH